MAIGLLIHSVHVALFGTNRPHLGTYECKRTDNEADFQKMHYYTSVGQN